MQFRIRALKADSVGHTGLSYGADATFHRTYFSLWSPYGIGQTIIFLPLSCGFFLLLKHWKILKFSPLRKKHPIMRFFRKMAPITTSGSGFYFIFVMSVLELIENDINVDRYSGQFLPRDAAMLARSWESLFCLSVRLYLRPSIRLSHACFVTNPKNLPAIFLYHVKGQSF